MYVVAKEGMKLGSKARQVVEVCKAGGFARYALETQWRGGEKFETRVFDSQRQRVAGLGYKAVHDAIALGFLESRPVPRGSTWAQEWVASSKPL